MRSANYVVETTTSIASSGAGAVTLTAITNRPRFSTVFGTQNTTVRYVIEDTVNKKFEEGVGAVSSNVLTRTRPQITWDGSTWNDQAPSALTFTGSPSSGDIKIRIAPVAEHSMGTINMKQIVVAGEGTWDAYPWSAHFHTAGNGNANTLTVDQEVYQPYKLPFAGLLSGAQFEVTNNVAGSNLKWALYSMGYDGLPGSKIVNFVTTSCATTGVKTDTATASWSPAGKVWLVPGWYYIGLISGHAVGIRNFGSGNTFLPQESPLPKKNGYGNGPWISVAGSYTTGLPATPNLSGGALQDPGVHDFMWLGLKVVS